MKAFLKVIMTKKKKHHLFLSSGSMANKTLAFLDLCCVEFQCFPYDTHSAARYLYSKAILQLQLISTGISTDKQQGDIIICSGHCDFFTYQDSRRPQRG